MEGTHDDLSDLTQRYNYGFFNPKGGRITSYNVCYTKLLRIDVIALGGIDASHIDEVRNLGFDGVALLGVLWLPFVNDSNRNNFV